MANMNLMVMSSFLSDFEALDVRCLVEAWLHTTHTISILESLLRGILCHNYILPPRLLSKVFVERHFMSGFSF